MMHVSAKAVMLLCCPCARPSYAPRGRALKIDTVMKLGLESGTDLGEEEAGEEHGFRSLSAAWTTVWTHADPRVEGTQFIRGCKQRQLKLNQ